MLLKKFSCFILSFLLVLSFCICSFADVATSSNAVLGVTPAEYLLTSTLSDDAETDGGISLYSSFGTVTNTVKWAGSSVCLHLYNTVTGEDQWPDYQITKYTDTTGYYKRSLSDLGYSDDWIITGYGITLRPSNLPVSGSYLFSADISSQLSYDAYLSQIESWKYNNNASTEHTRTDISNYTFDSGDYYVSDFGFNLTNVDVFRLWLFIPQSVKLHSLDINYRFRFDRIASNASLPSTAGTDTSSQDIQHDIANNTSQIVNSVSNMSSDLSDAAESLEYISQSQNLIIQGIDNVIMHISDQLYAFWDQLYNLIHVPTYDKLNEILAALKAIANNSDISAVVDEIEESTQDQTGQIIANDNVNTSKVEQAVEKHGNFIIEGLKGLFIPSDEFFKSYFDDLYTYFSDRFGFLSFPIDLLARLVDLFVNSSDVDCVLTLPSFEISGEQLLTEQSFNLTDFLEENFPFVLSSIRMVTSVALIMAFIDLCGDKWDEVMKN